MPDSSIIEPDLRGGVLSRDEIRFRIERQSPPLLRDFTSLDAQLQPNGFDLTLAKVESFAVNGAIAIENSGRKLPELEPVEPDADGWLTLAPGPWHITYNEVVALPNDLMALGRPRSSLGRSGVAIHTAVWDAGYEGRSTSLLHVMNPRGFRVQIGARVLQLIFMTLNTRTSSGYSGQYQGENI